MSQISHAGYTEIFKFKSSGLKELVFETHAFLEEKFAQGNPHDIVNYYQDKDGNHYFVLMTESQKVKWQERVAAYYGAAINESTLGPWSVT